MRVGMLLLGLVWTIAGQAAEPVPGLSVPPGFILSEYAGPKLANDVYALHIDATGRVVVSGRGYVRQLLDTDQNGQADTSRNLVEGLTDGPMGMLWEQDTLYLVVDGGLKRCRTVTGERPISIRSAETILKVRTSGEHDAHAVRRGPDGRLYLLCGNMAGITKNLITHPQSPIVDPVAGCLIRFDDAGGQLEVYADGFRNAYDFDFDRSGVPHTYDSDNERCLGLPWYEPTRFYRVIPGGHYGWRHPPHTQTWRRPPYFPDVVAPLATLGRGSPTGVVCYRHTQFPARYQGGFFLADWTFGRIWFVPPNGKPERFLESTGETGFAPTGLAIHPTTGELFVSIGGRGTRGSVYRIRAEGGPATPQPLPLGLDPRPGPMVKPEPPTLRLADLAQATGAEAKLRVVRNWQRSLGDFVSPRVVGTVWEGYTLAGTFSGRVRREFSDALRAAFPSGDVNLDRELSRTLAALMDDDDATIPLIMAKFSTHSDPVEDVHYLIVLARLGGKRTDAVTTQTAATLLRLDPKWKHQGLSPERNWYQRMVETTTVLLAEDAALATTLLMHPEFGEPGHVWLTRLPGLQKETAARRFLEVARRQSHFVWSRELVELLTLLPEAEFRPHLNAIWAQGGLEDALIPLYARNATESDRPKFVVGLRSLQPGTVTQAAEALNRWATGPDAELLAAIQALHRLGTTRSEAKTVPKAELLAREAIVRLLRKRTGAMVDPTAKAWEDWLTQSRPELARQLRAKAPNLDDWSKRLASLKWDQGDATRGARVYTKTNCAACHDGGQAAGPSLVGVGKRFHRDDLLLAILDPNREVPARYRTTRLTLSDGRVYDGLIVYEANDGIILQTGIDTTVRVPGERIESRKLLPTSLMPSGLLEGLRDEEIIDLVAYLRRD